jgi:DNA repair exonuclease SbcCD ATPase subunit
MARALLATEELRPEHRGVVGREAAALSALNGSLLQRVARLLGKTDQDRPEDQRSAVMLLLVMGLVAMAALASQESAPARSPSAPPAAQAPSAPPSPAKPSKPSPAETPAPAKAPKPARPEAPPPPPPPPPPAVEDGRLGPDEVAAMARVQEAVRETEMRQRELEARQRHLEDAKRQMADQMRAGRMEQERAFADIQAEAEATRAALADVMRQASALSKEAREVQQKQAEAERRRAAREQEARRRFGNLESKRAKLYVKYGPPDEIETHKDRNREMWLYRQLPGVGDDVIFMLPLN